MKARPIETCKFILDSKSKFILNYEIVSFLNKHGCNNMESVCSRCSGLLSRDIYEHTHLRLLLEENKTENFKSQKREERKGRVDQSKRVSLSKKI